jgi:hypothetical protein
MLLAIFFILSLYSNLGEIFMVVSWEQVCATVILLEFSGHLLYLLPFMPMHLK